MIPSEYPVILKKTVSQWFLGVTELCTRKIQVAMSFKKELEIFSQGFMRLSSALLDCFPCVSVFLSKSVLILKVGTSHIYIFNSNHFMVDVSENEKHFTIVVLAVAHFEVQKLLLKINQDASPPTY